eukprot:103097-Chlamydomonas_euryale.AAC.1
MDLSASGGFSLWSLWRGVLCPQAVPHVPAVRMGAGVAAPRNCGEPHGVKRRRTCHLAQGTCPLKLP